METKDIFRKKAVDRVNSPEQLNDYIRVTSPSIWMVLAGVICILAGAIVWGIFGNLYTTVDGAGIVYDRNLTVYIRTADRPNVEEGMTINCNGTTTTVRSVGEQPVRVTQDMGEFVLQTAGLQDGEWAYPVEADTELPDGSYAASIVTEGIHPISFIVH